MIAATAKATAKVSSTRPREIEASSLSVAPNVASGANTITVLAESRSPGVFGGRYVMAPRHSRPDAYQARMVVPPGASTACGARRPNNCTRSSGTGLLLKRALPAPSSTTR